MTKDELESAIKVANLWAGRSTLVLAVGILGEYVLLPFLEEKRWHLPAKIFFAFLVVAGIVGEYRFSSQISQDADELQTISDSETAAATRAATEAQLKLASLQSKLIDIFGPRVLSKEQLSRITGKLSKFKGVKVDIFALAVGNPYNPTESEDSRQLTKALVGAFSEAHLNTEGWVVGDCQTGVGVSNVVVSLTDSSKHDQAIPLGIIEALRTEVGTFPQLQTDGENFSIFCKKIEPLGPRKRLKADARIIVSVGRKIPSVVTLDTLGLSAPGK